MTDKLINGDYALVPDTKALTQCDYTDELLQNAAILLSAHRGKFYPDKNFGSRIYKATQPLEESIAAYAVEALGTLDGVYVKSVSIDGSAAYIRLMINNTEKGVLLNLEHNL
ncbi:MAG: hypothetical protein E7520_04295 [Ruminococcaceae bacterium]|nr:hypothetical protein [Oscillospiraceae bacterium]